MFLGAGDIVWFIVITMAIAVFHSGPGFLLRSVTTDVVDSDIVETGQQRTSTFFALLEMSTKFAPTIAVTVVHLREGDDRRRENEAQMYGS